MADHSLFISDLHLSVQRPDITAAFVRFCAERAIHASSLYILGDLSDACSAMMMTVILPMYCAQK